MREERKKEEEGGDRKVKIDTRPRYLRPASLSLSVCVYSMYTLRASLQPPTYKSLSFLNSRQYRDEESEGRKEFPKDIATSPSYISPLFSFLFGLSHPWTIRVSCPNNAILTTGAGVTTLLIVIAPTANCRTNGNVIEARFQISPTDMMARDKR